MSVIFGIKEEKEIIITGDKRGTNILNGLHSDDTDKITVINEHLAFASAGNHAIETAINMDVDKIKDKEVMSTDDLLDVIKAFYNRVNETGATTILSMPFYFFIAGKGRDSGASLISGCNSKGHFSAQEVPMALYPPADAQMEACCNIFAKNYKLHHSDFVERTVQEISSISQYVSATGDKWGYNIKAEKGVLYTF